MIYEPVLVNFGHPKLGMPVVVVKLEEKPEKEWNPVHQRELFVEVIMKGAEIIPPWIFAYVAHVIECLRSTETGLNVLPRN